MDLEALDRLITEALASWNVTPTSEAGRLRRAVWTKHFRAEDVGVFHTALRRAIDAYPQRMPTVGQFAQLIAVVKADIKAAQRKKPEPEPPMSAAERREVAEQLAMEAADRAARRGGPDVWSRYLEQIAEIYAENANRSQAGQALRPLPHIADLVGVLAGRAPVPESEADRKARLAAQAAAISEQEEEEADGRSGGGA